jgi:hypothetical protein
MRSPRGQTRNAASRDALCDRGVSPRGGWSCGAACRGGPAQLLAQRGLPRRALEPGRVDPEHEQGEHVGRAAQVEAGLHVVIRGAEAVGAVHVGRGGRDAGAMPESEHGVDDRERQEHDRPVKGRGQHPNPEPAIARLRALGHSTASAESIHRLQADPHEVHKVTYSRYAGPPRVQQLTPAETACPRRRRPRVPLSPAVKSAAGAAPRPAAPSP